MNTYSLIYLDCGEYTTELIATACISNKDGNPRDKFIQYLIDSMHTNTRLKNFLEGWLSSILDYEIEESSSFYGKDDEYIRTLLKLGNMTVELFEEFLVWMNIMYSHTLDIVIMKGKMVILI